MADEQRKIRFGIVGCANIARKVSRSILLTPNATISAVGSRSAERAAAFAAENGFPGTVKVYGSYEGVLEDPEVDAVYVPLPTSMHVRWAVAAAERRKHVLLEKPVAMNVAELDRILAACEANGVVYMDATMWMHHPRTVEMKEFLDDPNSFGQLKYVHANLSYFGGSDFLKNDIRVQPNLDGLGALGDIGWYCIRAILWAMDYELPKSVRSLTKPEVNAAGVILSCGGSLEWEDGRTGTFYASFLGNTAMDVCVYGSHGNLRLHDFVIPFEENVGSFYTVRGSRFKDRCLGVEPSPREHVVSTELPQEALMVREFCCLVDKSGGENGVGKEWGVISRKTQLVVDAVKQSIENGFKAVEVVY